MGRVRRQRRYKSCDPFSKEGERPSDKFDLAPKSEEFDDHFLETKSDKIFKHKVGLASHKNKARKSTKAVHGPINTKKLKTSKANVKDVVKTALPKQPNETQKQYFQRLDDNIQNAVNKAMKDQHKIRKKRKQHLKARDDKKKSKSIDEEKNFRDFKSLKDDVMFGEVVNAPPIINFKPKKLTNPTSTIEKSSSLILSSMLKDNTKHKKRKDMSANEMKDHDNNRQAAIDAYRLIKKRKEKRDLT